MICSKILYIIVQLIFIFFSNIKRYKLFQILQPMYCIERWKRVLGKQVTARLFLEANVYNLFETFCMDTIKRKYI